MKLVTESNPMVTLWEDFLERHKIENVKVITNELSIREASVHSQGGGSIAAGGGSASHFFRRLIGQQDTTPKDEEFRSFKPQRLASRIQSPTSVSAVKVANSIHGVSSTSTESPQSPGWQNIPNV